jgi:hypothetical protein
MQNDLNAALTLPASSSGRHMRIDFQRDSRVGVPELCLGHRNRNSEISKQTAVKMQEPVPAHARNAAGRSLDRSRAAELRSGDRHRILKYKNSVSVPNLFPQIYFPPHCV